MAPGVSSCWRTLRLKVWSPLVEKPVAPNVKIGSRLLRRIEEGETYCMAGHTLRFNTVCRALRAEVSSLGRLDTMVFSQRFPPQLGV